MNPSDGNPQGNPPAWGSPQSPPNAFGENPFRPGANNPYQNYGQMQVQPAPMAPPQKGVMKSPRLVGLGSLALGAAIMGFNYWSVTSDGRYYIKMMFLGPVVLVWGLFLLAAGQPLDSQSGKPVLWWRIGSGIALALGMLMGGAALWAVNQ